jgi:hypothetical protein
VIHAGDYPTISAKAGNLGMGVLAEMPIRRQGQIHPAIIPCSVPIHWIT